MVKFTKSAEETNLIEKIVDRAIAMGETHGQKYDRCSLQMDLSATNSQCPLRLAELLEASEANFAHDIFGISHNLNRITGKLANCFLPRFAK